MMPGVNDYIHHYPRPPKRLPRLSCLDVPMISNQPRKDVIPPMQQPLLRRSLPTLPMRPHLPQALHNKHPSSQRHRPPPGPNTRRVHRQMDRQTFHPDRACQSLACIWKMDIAVPPRTVSRHKVHSRGCRLAHVNIHHLHKRQY